MIADSQLHDELKRLHEQATRVWAALNEYTQDPGTRTRKRKKITRKAYKLSDATWDLYRESVQEFFL